MRKKGIFKIVSKNRAWHERLLAAVFFSLIVYVVFIFFKNNQASFTEKYYIKISKTLSFLFFLITLGIKFSVITNHHFDFDLNRYRIYYSVGPIGIGRWNPMNKLDRVSTFVNKSGECEVVIWSIKNNRYKIAFFDEVDSAVIFGRELAEKLKIEFKERK